MEKIKLEKAQKIIVILGSTASGKSDLAIKLAIWLSKQPNRPEQSEGLPMGAEIISADSRQVYKGMDIGTGKVTKRDQKLVPHHLLDVTSPKKRFTVADFKSRASRAISEIVCRHKLPIIVGGSGLYIDALIYDLEIPEVKPDLKLRAQFSKLAVEKLFERLKKLDPKRAQTIDPHNKRRLIRALEIINAIGSVPYLSTNYSLLPTNYSVLWLGLNPKDLGKRIAKRLDKRLEQGMIAEIKKLHSSGVSWKRLEDLGLEYRFVSQFLKNGPYANRGSSISLFKKSQEYRDLLTAIRQYSKRQMTWFKRNPKTHWLKSETEAKRLVRNFLQRI